MKKVRFLLDNQEKFFVAPCNNNYKELQLMPQSFEPYQKNFVHRLFTNYANQLKKCSLKRLYLNPVGIDR